jgi:hypothetical protein
MLLELCVQAAILGAYVWEFNRQCVTGHDTSQHVLLAKSIDDLDRARQERVPSVMTFEHVPYDAALIEETAHQVLGIKGKDEPWSSDILSKWLPPLSGPVRCVIKGAYPTWFETTAHETWLLPVRSATTLLLASPLKGDMRVWRLVLPEGMPMWVPRGWWARPLECDFLVLC